MDKLLQKLPSTSEVHVASMIIDDLTICEALATRLRRGNFSCSLVVDKQHFEEEQSRYQKSRLQKLQQLGAKVFVATGSAHSGSRYNGSMHMKNVVLDSSVAFSGSANMTAASRKNFETTLMLTGPPVAKILRSIKSAQSSGSQLA